MQRVVAVLVSVVSLAHASAHAAEVQGEGVQRAEVQSAGGQGAGSHVAQNQNPKAQNPEIQNPKTQNPTIQSPSSGDLAHGESITPEVVRAASARRPAPDRAFREPFVKLRRRLRLPAKQDDALRCTVRAGSGDAMQHVSAGLRELREAGEQEADARRTPENWERHVQRRDQRVRRHFEGAIVDDPASIEALLALAATSRDAVLARLAIDSIPRRQLQSHASPRTVALLIALLEHPSSEAAALAFAHLEFLLDAGHVAGAQLAGLFERGAQMWPREDKNVRPSQWMAWHEYLPDQPLETVLPAPRDLASQLVVLSAVRGDPTVMNRLVKGDIDPRIQLHAHRLAAPRVSADQAVQMFGWYRRGPERWDEKHDRDVNAWKYGVISILVGLLPQLPEKRLPWFERHLTRGTTGQAAQSIACYRIACLERVRAQSWFGEGARWLRELEVRDALSLWRFLARNEHVSLRESLEAAPQRSSTAAADRYLRCILRSVPLGDFALEFPELERAWRSARSSVARAIAERAMLHGVAGRAAVHDWLRRASKRGGGARRTAYELSIRYGLPLAVRDWPASAVEMVRLQRLHDAVHADDHAALGRFLRKPERGSNLHRRCILWAACRASQWSPELAELVGMATTARDVDTRRAAYSALLSGGARRYAVARLATEAAYDRAPEVRALLGPVSPF